MRRELPFEKVPLVGVEGEKRPIDRCLRCECRHSSDMRLYIFPIGFCLLKV